MASIRPIRPPAEPANWIEWSFAQVFNSRRRVATCAVGVLALGVAYHVIFGENGLTVYQQKRLDAQTLERQMDDLTRENDALQGHVDRLQHDPSAIEHQAREELHYTRPGEVIYTLPEPVQPAKR